MRSIKTKNSPILTCPVCARRYIQTEKLQDKCLFCLKDIHNFATLQNTDESDIM